MRPGAVSVSLLFSLFLSHSPTRLFVLVVLSSESAVAQLWAGGFCLVVLSLSRSFFHFYKEYFNGTSRSNHGLRW